MKPRQSLVLIGMPGAGKSTLGGRLANMIGADFIDTDHLIEKYLNTTLQSYLNTHGYLALRKIEELVILGVELNGAIVATGGSAVYSKSAMEYLRTFSKIVFINVPLDTVLQRVTNRASRGIAANSSMTLQDLYYERLPLYKNYADVCIDTSPFCIEESLNLLHELWLDLD